MARAQAIGIPNIKLQLNGTNRANFTERQARPPSLMERQARGHRHKRSAPSLPKLQFLDGNPDAD